jgi:hypothetical protein
MAGLGLDVLEAIGQPQLIVAGRAGELLAMRQTTSEKWLIVVYRETDNDGLYHYSIHNN